jgi:hypothetical protein
MYTGLSDSERMLLLLWFKFASNHASMFQLNNQRSFQLDASTLLQPDCAHLSDLQRLALGPLRVGRCP